ncbi:unnamed protein product [Peronospora belbahrii]|uniref:MSP domain-containing protein n=1 Tax=Peronospora belbahrii TaxID=622444 RepID=A0AAU9LCW6_9STRA|nr:unnamed protein product [Peronospora belbahrii]
MEAEVQRTKSFVMCDLAARLSIKLIEANDATYCLFLTVSSYPRYNGLLVSPTVTVSCLRPGATFEATVSKDIDCPDYERKMHSHNIESSHRNNFL